MKLKLISTLIAASFLAGCSSNGSSNGGEAGPAPQDGIADVTYRDGVLFESAIVKGDGGTNSVIVKTDEQTVVRINGENYFVNNNVVEDKHGNQIGHIEKIGDTFIFKNQHDALAVFKIENGRLVIVEAQEPTDPDFGIPPLDGDLKAKYTVSESNGWYYIYNDGIHIGTITISESGTPIFWKKDGGHHTMTNVTIDQKEKTVTYINDKTNEIITWTPEGGLDFGTKSPKDNPEYQALKSKIQSLSQEQRQQIKQAVKDRVNRS
ncbi:hypothetical protein [Vibrio nomapromontoriensis]|uniref:hypothetical protein n=1 Tax=Vibrio nomapromontoriensis TaxID=2910246 RepID=UPI003D0B1BEE